MRLNRLFAGSLRKMIQFQCLIRRFCVKYLRFLLTNIAKISACCCISIALIFILLTFLALFYSIYLSVSSGRMRSATDPLDSLTSDLDEYDPLEAIQPDGADWSAMKQRQRLLRLQRSMELLGDGKSLGGDGGWRRRIRLAKARHARARKKQRVAKSEDFIDEEPFDEAVPDPNKPEAPLATQMPVRAMEVKPRHLSRKARDTHLQLKQLEQNSWLKCWNSLSEVFTSPFAKVKYYLIERSICEAEVDILLLVSSHWSHYERRELIRSTYASLNNVRDSIIRVVFVTGLPHGSGDRADILQESRSFGDIVIGDFSDNHSRLLLKDFLSMHWALNYCPTAKFVAKLSDATFVDTVHLATFLDRLPMQDFLYCTIQRDQKPSLRFIRGQVIRGVKPSNKLQPHCDSNSFLTDASSLARLLGCSRALQPESLTDSGDFLTGAAMAKAGLSLVEAWKGHGFGQLNRKTALPPLASDYIFLTVQQRPDGPSLPGDVTAQQFLWRATWKYLVAQYEF